MKRYFANRRKYLAERHERLIRDVAKAKHRHGRVGRLKMALRDVVNKRLREKA